MNVFRTILRDLFRGLPRPRSTALAVLFVAVVGALVAFGSLPRSLTARDPSGDTPPTYVVYLPNTPNVSPPGAPAVDARTGGVPPTQATGGSALPTVAPDVGAVPTISSGEAPLPPIAQSTPTDSSGPSAAIPSSLTPYRVYLPAVGNGGVAETPTVEAATPTPIPSATAVAAPPSAPGTAPTRVPIPTRPPIRITKLGLGVYDSGGSMLPDLDLARPSVILLQDPSGDFAREVRQHFPNAFIVGRVFSADQPLDNPAQRGHDFADRVASVAVPLKGVVNAWISYNEVASSTDPSRLANYCAFQVAFAHHLQDDYGIPAVAANDGPRAVTAADYVRYCGDAIRTSKYFGFHLYTNPDVTSLRDPRAADQVFAYRQIHDALAAAGISSGPFIATEAGLYNGWRGVTSDTSMSQDFLWLADQMNQDPYVLGECVYGLFIPGRWSNFNIDGSSLPQTMGDYNTVH